MNNLPEFQAFPKIFRLKRHCIVTEKIDGTNAQIFVTENEVLAGSRNRWITPDADNYDFASWVVRNKDALLLLGIGRHYGEWWGVGIQRRYGLSERRFSLFNTSLWTPENPPPPCCSVVPVLYKGEFSTEAIDRVTSDLRTNGSVAAPGFMNPEGIVVFLPAGGSMHKFTLDGDGHKEHR